MRENVKKPLFGPGVPKQFSGSQSKVGSSNVEFQRKSFNWTNEHGQADQSLWLMTWTPVGTIDPAIAREPDLSDEVPSNIKAATAEIMKARPPCKAMSVVKEQSDDGPALLTRAQAQLSKALIADEKIDRAMTAANRAIVCFQKDGDRQQEAQALSVVVRCMLADNNFEDGLHLASELRALYNKLGDSEGELEAMRIVIKSHVAQKDSNAAVQAAMDLRSQFQTKGDKKQEAAAVRLVVDTQVAVGRSGMAVSTADEAREYFKKAGDKQGEAVACLASASAHTAQRAYGDALSAQIAAQALYSQLKDKESEADVLKAVCLTHFSMSSPSEAEKAAQQMLSLYRSTGDKAGEATALQFVCIASNDKGSGSEATDIFDELDDKEGAAAAKHAIASAHLANQDADAALQAGKEAVALFKESGAPGLSAALLICAQANIMKGHSHSAMWDAKQALRHSVLCADGEGQQAASKILSSIQQANDKGMSVGPSVPITVPLGSGKTAGSVVEFM